MTESRHGLAPQSEITPDELHHGLRLLVMEAAYSSATTALTSGVILTAFALHLGASNFTIGLLASAPFLGQLLQGLAILLVERVRERKRIVVICSTIMRFMLLFMGLSVFVPAGLALATLVLAQCLLCGVSAFGTCAWNAWIRDLAPERQMGAIFAQRTVYATAVSLAAGLVAAFTLDRPGGMEQRDLVFAGLYSAGFVAGLISLAILSRIPEPQMPPPSGERISLINLLRGPFGDRNFRRLIGFLMSWQFAANLATPFFTVYLLRQLHFDMTFVMVLSMISQVANLLALRNWGALSDRFANKSVLTVAAPTYVLCITAMVGASQIDTGPLLVGYLVILHALMGLSVAGVTLATTNISLKLSPKGGSTAYVASAALASSLAAGLAPILGGLFADFFEARRFEVLFRWTSPKDIVLVTPLQLSSWDFYFIFAGLLGVYALHRLALVREEGEVERRDLVQHMLHQTRRSVRNLSTVAGFRAATEFPSNLMREARARKKLRSRAARQSTKGEV